MSLVGNLLRSFMERGARDLSYEDLMDRLRVSGEEIAGRMAAAADTSGNRQAAAHIIGIERWGRQRLGTALGQTLVMDQYNGYRPAVTLTMPALAELFGDARASTLDLVARLVAAGVKPSATVPHNDMGDLTIRAWLFYLNSHATREAGRIK
jgi:hypothetical protein